MNETYWNYRVIRHVTEILGEWFAIHEVYYEKGKPVAVTESPSYPMGETIEELQEDVQYFNQAFRRSVLDYEMFDKKYNILEDEKDE